MSPTARVAWLTGRRAARQWWSTRTVVALPLLLLAIPGSAWGLSDSKTTLPADIPLDTPMQMLFVSSLFILLTATLAAVLYAWDGVSRDRASGVLEVHLGRGMGRRGQATVIAASHLMVTTLPVLLLAMVAIVIIRIRTGAWASFGDSVVFLGSTVLVVTWYTAIALLASSYARDQGTAIAFGVGVWFLFTMLWLLVTSVLAGLAGIEVGSTANAQWVQFEAMVDLLSPNGVYHHLLELRLDGVDRGLGAGPVLLAALAWTVLPLWWFQRRIERLVP